MENNFELTTNECETEEEDPFKEADLNLKISLPIGVEKIFKRFT